LPDYAVINSRSVLIDDYDDKHLIVFIETGSDLPIEIAVIGILTGQTVHRFRPPFRLRRRMLCAEPARNLPDPPVSRAPAGGGPAR
jgi:hypothetical protein